MSENLRPKYYRPKILAVNAFLDWRFVLSMWRGSFARRRGNDSLSELQEVLNA